MGFSLTAREAARPSCDSPRFSTVAVAFGSICGHERDLSQLVEPATLDSINKRIAELIQQYEIQKNRPRRVIFEELSELVVIRDELKKIQQRAADKPVQLSRSLPKEFPTLGALVHRLNSIALQIAEIPKDDPHRPELLNEITRLCLVADSLHKREL